MMARSEEMSDEEGWRRTHRELSAEDLRFREFARSSPSLLDRASFLALEQNRELLKFRLQPWLTFMGKEKLRDLQQVSVGIFNLLVGLPRRLFGQEPARFAEFYGLGSPLVAEILFSPPTGIESIVSRGDFIDTPQGFQCIEFNFTPSLGGWDTTILTGLHLEVPATVRALEELKVRVAYTDTMRQFFLHLLRCVERQGLTGGGEVGFTVMMDHFDRMIGRTSGLAYLQGELERALVAAGKQDLRGWIEFCQYSDLVTTREGVFYGRKRVHGVLELCEEATPAPIYRAFKAGQVLLLNGPLEAILSTKRNVALLSQFADSGAFTREERDFITRHVPWTRLVTLGTSEWRGEKWPLPALLRARKEHFVLKEAASYGGKGVVLGRFTSSEEWSNALDRALASGQWIVQEHKESLPYLYQSGDYGCSVHDMVWGPFVFGGSYGGVVLRMQPKADMGAVNLSLHATEGIVLEV
jgi:hypothetical protein